jgi:CarD family transcriptional regulator
MGSNGNGHFQIGERVVYPNHGVGIVEQIGTRTLGQQVERYYLLNIKSSNLKVTVPFHSVSNVGLRPVVKNGEIQKILSYLEDGNIEVLLTKTLSRVNLRFPEAGELAS